MPFISKSSNGTASLAGNLFPWMPEASCMIAGILTTVAGVTQPEQQLVADSNLLQRTSRGDKDAFDALLAQHGSAVFGFLQRRARVRETAEDLFQETWIRVINNAHTFRAECPVRPWLYRIALNTLNDHFRREGALRRGGGVAHGDLEEAADVAVKPQVSLELTQQNEQLHRAVQALPEAYREVVRLRYFEELSTDDVAQVLDCAAGTVKSRLSRGLALLQEQLEELR